MHRAPGHLYRYGQNDASEAVSKLKFETWKFLVELIPQRLIQHRRSELIAQVAEAREAYQTGNVRRGSVEGLMKELDS